MDEWEKINETTLPEKKKNFIETKHGKYYKLRLMNVKRVCKDF